MHAAISNALFLPTFAWNYCLARVLRQRRWWDEVTPHVFLGALPLRRDVPKLAQLGVRGVINLCREYRGPLREYRKFGIEQLWLPTVDFNPPSVPDIAQGVKFLDDMTGHGKKVYVHCKAGRARSATVVLCWLVHSCGMTPEQAQAHLLRVRPHVHARLLERQAVQAFLKLSENGGGNRTFQPET
jgi:atypical dual specificity phosphatase